MLDNDLYYTISKTANIIGVRSHVLRFWEKKFSKLNPKKGPSGRRFYSSSDIETLSYIKKLLYNDGFTIKGAVNFFEENYKNKKIDKEYTINDDLDNIIKLLNEGSAYLKKYL